MQSRLKQLIDSWKAESGGAQPIPAYRRKLAAPAREAHKLQRQTQHVIMQGTDHEISC